MFQRFLDRLVGVAIWVVMIAFWGGIGVGAVWAVDYFFLNEPAPTTAMPPTESAAETVNAAFQTPPTTDAAAAALGSALAANEATLAALEENYDEALRGELTRIERAAERETTNATNRLTSFRSQVVAFWADFWIDPPVSRDSLEGFELAVWPETAMLHEIDFALSQVEPNVETAASNAKYEAEQAASASFRAATTHYYGCLNATMSNSVWATAEDVAGCGSLLEFDDPDWPAHDWSCVRDNVEAVLSMRPDDDYILGRNTEAQIARIFNCHGFELPDP